MGFLISRTLKTCDRFSCAALKIGAIVFVFPFLHFRSEKPHPPRAQVSDGKRSKVTTTTKCYCKKISRNVVIARKITESVRFGLFLAELLEMALKRPSAYQLAQRVVFHTCLPQTCRNIYFAPFVFIP